MLGTAGLRGARLASLDATRRAAPDESAPVVRIEERQLTSGNGSEFIATKLKDFLVAAKVETLYIEPGSP